jgi:uncharacterized repeat protein (TIGR01451 family)
MFIAFLDPPPTGLSFVPGTVTVNGVPDATLDPNNGFIIPDIPGGSEDAITFDAQVDFLPSPNIFINRAFTAYAFNPVECGLLNFFSLISNDVPLEVISADVAVNKSAIPNPVAPGQTLNYAILVLNAGPADAQNVVLTDAIPAEIINSEFSTDGGATWNSWTGSYNVGTLPNGASRTILIRGTVTRFNKGNIFNTARVTSTTPDPNLANNTSTAETFICNHSEMCCHCKTKGCHYCNNTTYNSFTINLNSGCLR